MNTANQTHFTPGPWSIIESAASTTERSEHHIGTPERTVAVVYSDRTTPGNFRQAMENALLIASAPELLSALEGLLALNCIKVVENIHGDKAVAIKTARAVIQRAKGGNALGSNVQANSQFNP